MNVFKDLKVNQMDKYIEKLWEKYSGVPLDYDLTCIREALFYEAVQEAMQAQREACCLEFMTEYNSGNYDDPITFMTTCKDKILNAEVGHENPELLEGL